MSYVCHPLIFQEMISSLYLMWWIPNTSEFLKNWSMFQLVQLFAISTAELHDALSFLISLLFGSCFLYILWIYSCTFPHLALLFIALQNYLKCFGNNLGYLKFLFILFTFTIALLMFMVFAWLETFQKRKFFSQSGHV